MFQNLSRQRESRAFLLIFGRKWCKIANRFFFCFNRENRESCFQIRWSFRQFFPQFRPFCFPLFRRFGRKYYFPFFLLLCRERRIPVSNKMKFWNLKKDFHLEKDKYVANFQPVALFFRFTRELQIPLSNQMKLWPIFPSVEARDFSICLPTQFGWHMKNTGSDLPSFAYNLRTDFRIFLFLDKKQRSIKGPKRSTRNQ